MDVSVTFEFDTRQPETWKGLVEGGQVATVCGRAIRLAHRALKPRSWRSVVCLAQSVVADATNESNAAAVLGQIGGLSVSPRKVTSATANLQKARDAKKARSQA